MNDEEIREALAEYAHEAWSGWMQYLFSKSDGPTPDHGLGRLRKGSFIILPECVERWQRQMNTPYAELPEYEKALDRTEADRMLAIMARKT